ncbi:MAG: cell envelope integrity protein TolA [Burkholderiales bacterium]
MRPTPPSPKRGLAAMLAILVHVLFFALLVFSLDWKTHAPEPVMVELWQPPPPVPVVSPQPPAAVKPVPPEPVKAEPVVPNPDIALEQKRKLAAQQQRDAELLAQQQALQKQQEEKKAEDKKKKREQKKLAQQQLQKQQAAELAQEKLAEQKAAEQKLAQEKQMQEKKQAALRKLVAQQTRAEFQNESAHALNSRRQAALASKQSAEQAQMKAAYIEKIKAKVRSMIILPDGLQGNPTAGIDVTVLPTGEVVNVKLVRSSGQPAYDDAVERAILKASPLPLPPDAALAQQFRDLNLKFTPN